MTLTTPNPQPQPLTFPALTFAKLAPHSFLTAHLSHPTNPLRPSSRTPSQTRPPAINTGSLTHANGSAVVRCGDTAVVCGVRAEVLKVADVADHDPLRTEREDVVDDEDEDEAEGEEEEEEEEEDAESRAGRREREKRKRKGRSESDEMARLNLLVPNLELATGCSPAHLPGGPPSHFAQTLTQRILTLLHSSQMIPLSPLKIWFRPPMDSPPRAQKSTRMAEGAMDVEYEEEREQESTTKPHLQAFWTLYIDILFISLDGNAFDAAWLSVLAALNDTLLPKAWWDADREMVLCSDDADQATRLGSELRACVVPVSFGVFEGEPGPGAGGGGEGEGQTEKEKEKEKGQKWILLDMDAFEESLCKEHGTIVVGDEGRIVRLEKNGGGGVGVGEIRGLVEAAAKRREEWMRVLGGKV